MLYVIDELLGQEFQGNDLENSDPTGYTDLVYHDYYSDDGIVTVKHESYDHEPNSNACTSVTPRHHNNDVVMSDANIPDKNRGFLDMAPKQFEFIGPDRYPQKLTSVSDCQITNRHESQSFRI